MSVQNQQTNQTNNMNNHGLYTAIIRLLSNAIMTIKNKMGLYVICLLLGIAPFVGYYFSKSNTYEATFTLAYDELVRKIYGDRLEKLNTIVQSGEYNKVSAMLGVDKKAAQSLNKVEGYNILGEDLSKDMNTDRLPFVVSITINDTTNTLALQTGIVSFLETGNNFMAERSKIKKLETKEEISFIDQQLQVLEGLYSKSPNMQFNTTDISQQPKANDKPKTGTGSIYEYSYELYKRKQELMRKERMPGSIMVIDDAIVSTKACKPLWLLLAVGFVGGNFIFLVLAGLLIPAFRYKG
jgi:hypothetical protein